MTVTVQRRIRVWMASLVAAIGAGFAASKLETAPDQKGGTTSLISPESAILHSTSRRGSNRVSSSSGYPSAWLTVPTEWLVHFKPGVRSESIAAVLELTPDEQQNLQQAAEEALREARSLQARQLADKVMTLDRTIRLEALDDNTLESLTSAIVSALPASASLASRDLAEFLAERELRQEFGQALEITLERSASITTFDLRHLPQELQGYRYRMRWPEHPERGTLSHMIYDSRLGFLELDPEIVKGTGWEKRHE